MRLTPFQRRVLQMIAVNGCCYETQMLNALGRTTKLANVKRACGALYRGGLITRSMIGVMNATDAGGAAVGVTRSYAAEGGAR